MSKAAKLLEQLGLGGTDTCVCPKCNTEVTHTRGVPCDTIECPKCGNTMVGKGMPHTDEDDKNSEVDMDKKKLTNAVANFFIEHPYPSDDKVHDFADSLKMSAHDLEEIIYSLLTNLLRGVGKNRGKADSEFNSSELKMGIGIEKEHTDDIDIATQIAKDHLAEIPDYYTRLIKMEKDAKSKK